jgi:hypothetical protein
MRLSSNPGSRLPRSKPLHKGFPPNGRRDAPPISRLNNTWMSNEKGGCVPPVLSIFGMLSRRLGTSRQRSERQRSRVH